MKIRNLTILVLTSALLAALTSCSTCCCRTKGKSMQASVDRAAFGKLPDGAAIDLNQFAATARRQQEHAGG